jgi:DNA polymerase-3 subunit gamma/tau
MAEGYQVIARRWRPQQFDEIVGQEHIVRTLKNAIETNRIGHAYLFVGPRGTGKTTTARIFAKALNCTGGPKVKPDPGDPLCDAIVSGSCMDVIEIDAATNRSIEDAKTIRDECQYAPAQCKFKIFIIDEIHQLSKDAFNALLKTLEEPPPHIKFIFATTEAEKLLPTITSRCQRFEFQPISDAQIAGRLKEIAAADNVEITADALLTIARLANGGMRDSQSILDQAISFCGKQITAADIANIYGIASIEDINALFDAMSAGDFAKVVAHCDQFFTEGRDLIRVLQDIQLRVREALRETIQKGAAPGALATEQLLRILETLQGGEYSIKSGLSERASFEVTLLKAVEQSRSRAIDTLINEMAQLAAGLPTEAGEKKISAPPPPEPSPPLAIPRNGAAVSAAAWNTPTAPRSPNAYDAPLANGNAAVNPAVADASAFSAFDDGQPLESISGGEGVAYTYTAGASDIPEFDEDGNEVPSFKLQIASPTAAPEPEKILPPARPGSEDFEAAVAALPATFKTILEDAFHGTFSILAAVPPSRLLKKPQQPNLL